MSNARFPLRTALLIGATAALAALPAPVLSQIESRADSWEASAADAAASRLLPAAQAVDVLPQYRPRIQYRFGFVAARDRERSANSFGTQFFYTPGAVEESVEILVGVRFERQGLDFGSRYTGTALVGGAWPAGGRLQGRVSVGGLVDRTTIDFGMDSVSDTGTGYTFGGGIGYELGGNIALGVDVERQSTGGLVTRRALGWIDFAW